MLKYEDFNLCLLKQVSVKIITHTHYLSLLRSPVEQLCKKNIFFLTTPLGFLDCIIVVDDKYPSLP